MSKRTIFTIALSITLLAATLTVARGADPEYYVKKATWQDTVQASREALVDHLNKPGKPKVAAKPQLGSWYEIGPFTGGKFGTAFGPEKKIDLSKPDGKLKWKRIKVSDGVVHGMRLPGGAAGYFYRTITASAPASLMSYYGSDDGLAVWLNGKKIISKDVPRGPGANQDRAKLILKEGENHLLIKIWNRSGGSGWYFSTSEKAGGKKDIRTAMQEGIWSLAQRDFNATEARKQMAWEQGDNIWAADWKKGDLSALAKRYVSPSKGGSAGEKIATLAKTAKSANDLNAIRKLYYSAKGMQEALAQLAQFNIKALRLAIEDLTKSYPDKYPPKHLKRLKEIEDALAGDGGEEKIRTMAKQLIAFRREALLANPLLDFDKLMMVRRKGDLGLPQNWVGNCTKRGPFDNEITVLSPVRPDGKLTTLYRPESKVFVGDVDLHWDAKKMLFSSQLKNRRYEVFEIGVDGKGLRQVTKSLDGIDNYDACYLPSEKIIFDSTAVYQGVPCVGGGSQVANLYVMNPDGTGMRQLCFDQDHNWYPSVTNDGRVLFTRWEYSDTPHYFTRVIMGMNPDGTNQRSVYGSNSYWPNSTFYVRAVPNHSSRFVGVISGHHGVPRMGELILFDPAKGQHEADGVVQRIPGYGKKVEPIIRDALVNNSWPRFLHPFPLSDKYIITTCKLDAKSPWGVYLVDVFDNILPICVEPGVAMFEPIPLRKTKRPPVIPERVDLARKDAIIHMSDIYIGGGLKGVERGAVKKLRLFAFDYGYHGLANHTYIGIEGPWDVHRILGTVDVESDGSSSFHVPANTPIAVQPLDKDGAALQLMRSWFVAMPGENLSCVGCHENNNEAPPAAMVKASRKPPQKIKEWYGPARGFSFAREVQPVLDKYCIGCHNDKPRKGTKPPDLRMIAKSKGFSQAYRVLQKYVRRPGPESDYHMFPPAEYHASTSPLIQMLRKGHNNVKLDAEAYERIFTWIDLNVPYYGTWGEFRPIPKGQREKRSKFRQLYAGIDVDYEVVPTPAAKPVKTIMPKPLKETKPAKVACPNWPFDDAAAKTLQGSDNKRTITVTEGDRKLQIEMVRIPAGQFVMGDSAGALDERPICPVKIDKSFWIATKILTNAQYNVFDPKHDSRYLDRGGKDHSNRGNPLNRPTQPAIRVTWNRAMAFCAWMSKKTGKNFSLPTEAQWEFACRAGATADKSGSNVWGADLLKSQGEWTRTTYKPYPYVSTDGRDDGKPSGKKVVRGAHGLKTPATRRDTYRLSYQPWQPVWNVGFRVVCTDEDLKSIIANAK
ncbi:MAG: SUMF1/EgtB/PvdO family nonheme iron enzyme [Phycisphaerae bacterium]|nr:SUMF1/EgtB/PvdO family nonheme iron enzyme [Phycisphaerae bacterium]